MKNYIFGYENLYIYQDEDLFKMSLDSILLANFVTLNKKTKKILDIGTGTAAIPIILTTKTDANIIGVEIQEKLVKCAKKSINLNKFENRIEIINGDIKDVYAKFKNIDTLVSNPPYFKVGENINENQYLRIARHEVTLNIEEVIIISKQILKDKGNLAIVNRPERMVEIIDLMKKNNIEPKKIQFVYPKKGKKSNMLLIEGIKNGKSGLQILEPLYVYEKDDYTKELKEYIR